MAEALQATATCGIAVASSKALCHRCRILVDSENPDLFAVRMENCRHIFCNACLEIMVEPCVGAILPCYFVGKSEKCDGYLCFDLLKSFLPEHVFVRYQERVLAGRLPDDDDTALESLDGTAAKNQAVELTDEQKNDGWFHLLAYVKQQKETGASLATAERKIDLMSIVPTVYEIQCSICLSDVEPEEGVVIKECLHIFCRKCLQSHVEHSWEHVEVQCPYRGAGANEGYMCSAVLKPIELAQLCTKEAYEQRYIAKSITVVEGAANMLHCLTPNCKYFVEYNEESREQSITCPLCNQVTCIRCKLRHTGFTCQEYQSDLADEKNRSVQRQNEIAGEQEVQRRLDAGICKQCPQCKVVIEKNAGCDHMTCRSCRYEFYWTTGAPYQAGVIRNFVGGVAGFFRR